MHQNRPTANSNPVRSNDRRAPHVARGEFDLTTATSIDYIQRAAEHGLYEIRGLGAKRTRAAFRRPGVPRRARCRAIRWKAIARSARRKTVLGTRFAKKPIELEIPDHDRRHELRRAVGEREGSARPRGDRAGHVHHDRRRRHDAGRAAVVEDAGLPVPAVALRLQSRRPAQGRRDRDRHRPGRQARRRRHAARAEDQSARRGDAHAARRHRPALGVPASRLDRPGRPGDQDPRAARDHRLGEADLREDRRDARASTT